MESRFYSCWGQFFLAGRCIQFLSSCLCFLLLSGCAITSQNEKPNDQNAGAATLEVSKTLFTDRLKIQFEASKYLTSQATTEYSSANSKSTIESLTNDYVSSQEGYSYASVLPAFRGPDKLIYVPQKTSYEYSVASQNISVGYAFLQKEKFELWLSVGAAHDQFELDVNLSGPIDIYANVLPISNQPTSDKVKYVLQNNQTENISFGEHLSEVLPYVRMESIYKINSLFSVSARLSASWNAWSSSNEHSMMEEQTRFTYTPTDFIDVYLGYKFTNISVEKSDDETNFVRDLNLRGLVGGASLKF